MTLLAPTNSVTVIRGTSRTLRLTVKEALSGTVVDISGAVVHFTVKKCATDDQCVIRKSSLVAGEITVTTPREGLVEIFLVPADTHGLAEGNYPFDIWVILPTGERIQVVRASLRVEAGVTVLTVP